MAMMKPGQLEGVSVAWLLFLLLLEAPTAQALGNGSAAFRSVRLCPAAAGPANVTGLTDERACATECAARPDCVAAAHSPAEAACRLADPGQFVQGWRSSVSCLSAVSAQRLMAGGGIANALTSATRAALLVFHNFLLGTPNLAAGTGNASFAASLGPGARLTDSGVWLDGSAGAFVRIDTEAGNLTKYLGYGNQFTYFAKYQRAWQPGQSSVYIQEFTRSNSSSESGGDWHEFRSNATINFTSLSIEAQFATVNLSTSSQVFDLLPLSSSGRVFTAAAFNGTAFGRFYWNGTFYPAGVISSVYGNVSSDWNDKLRLGLYSPSTDWSMRGSFICWGVASGMLSASQLEEINALC